MRKATIAVLIILIAACLLVPTAFSVSDNNKIVVTYGETTYHNQDYKNTVDTYFKNQIHSDLNDFVVKIITAAEVNKISSSYSHRTYNSNDIFSSALLDLRGSDDLDVQVDSSKINVITKEMYVSALKSAGITKGHVYVTSPISATGESALAGIMNCYEQATNTTIPQEVKQAANNEISTEAEIVNNSNVSSDKLSQIVDDVKEEVMDKNITDKKQIVNIINNVTVNYNIHLSSDDVDKLASAILQTQQVQGSANQYKDKLSDAVGGNSIIDEIFKLFGF